ncbi:MAG: PspC domain-containing protein [Chitinophagaceae bacterium]
MKKVININFQSRVIPIEETAYEILQKYSESLRRHFANEEGRDEIISDIETRISELFSDTLKKGVACITDDEVNAVIDSMGHPEDFDADIDIHTNTENKSTQDFGGATTSDNTQTANPNQQANTYTGKRLYRDENHKILGGVCSGLANYFNIDPVIMRIIALVFFSVALIPYIVIWIAIPSSATRAIGSPRKRLFRDTESKKIAGVCSGLANYFGMNPKIVRLIFLIPFISIAFRESHWFGWGFPHFLSLSFSPAATITYIILWILVPKAKTTSDKLEMKGQPVDLNNIKNTVQNDLNEFKDKARKWWSNDAQNPAPRNSDENMTDNTTNTAYSDQQQFASVPPKTESRNSLSLLFKILVYIILGLIAAPILVALFSVGIGSMMVLPATDFVLKNGWETILSWGTFFFFIWVPIIGIILWFFRLITKSRRGSATIRGTFIGLWILGWICFFGLFSMVGHDFSHSANTPPTTYDYKDKNVQTMVVTAFSKEENNDWNDQDFGDFIKYLGNDSIQIPNVALKIEPSKDDNYHVESMAYSNGVNKEEATRLASKIQYQFDQKDSILFIPTQFFVNRNDKFRNQRVRIRISVPVGKQIIVKKDSHIKGNIDFSIGVFGIRKNNSWDNDNYWEYETLYVMTADGLKPVDENKSEKNEGKNEKTEKQSNTKKESDDEDEDDDKETTRTKSVTDKQFRFYSMASLLSNKFSL